VNDITTSDVVLQALEAVFNDGMDVALLSAGDLGAAWGPTDSGATCGLASGTACDPLVGAVATASLAGMTIVLPAGKDGGSGSNTINTPGDYASAITVGSTTKVHILASTLTTATGDRLQARLGDGPQPSGPVSVPLYSVSSIDATEHGCLGYPAGALSGKIALIAVGQCAFAIKVLNAQAAGAAAVVSFNPSDGAGLFPPTGLSDIAIPSALVSYASGAFLKTYLAAHPGAVVTLDPGTAEAIPATADTVSSFSSRGPNDLYSASRYIGVDGTSFAAALAAGGAALVRQADPGYSSGQIKSALTHTAASGITDFDANGDPFRARSIAVGGGKLNVGSAVASTLTMVPATVSFLAVNSMMLADGVLATRSVVITNTGSTSATLQLTVQQRDPDGKASVSVNPATLPLTAGQSASVTLTLSGQPLPGIYEGRIAIAGGAVPVQIP